MTYLDNALLDRKGLTMEHDWEAVHHFQKELGLAPRVWNMSSSPTGCFTLAMCSILTQFLGIHPDLREEIMEIVLIVLWKQRLIWGLKCQRCVKGNTCETKRGGRWEGWPNR